MKINKIMNKYIKLKKRNVVVITKNTNMETVLVANKFDQYTGEVVGSNSYKMNKADIDKQIKELGSKILNLKALRKDIK